jgi:hypothetical protein
MSKHAVHILCLRQALGLVATLIVCVLAAGFCTACSPSVSNYSYEKAIYVYMCGSTLESSDGAASSNINDMLAADIPSNTIVVIETGGATKWRGHGISSDAIERYIIQNHQLVKVDTCAQASMASKDTFADFLEFCTTNFRARSMGLVFWDHGNGMLGKVCFDANYGNAALSVSDITEVIAELDLSGEGKASAGFDVSDTSANLKTLASGSGGDDVAKSDTARDVKFDFIGFDACLMSNWDVASYLDPYANYMIASENLEVGKGWDWGYVVSNYGRAANTLEFAQGVCDAYIARAGQDCKDYLALAVVDLAEVSAAEDKMRVLVEDFTSAVANSEEVAVVFLRAVDDGTKYCEDTNTSSGCASISLAYLLNMMYSKTEFAVDVAELLDFDCVKYVAYSDKINQNTDDSDSRIGDAFAGIAVTIPDHDHLSAYIASYAYNSSDDDDAKLALLLTDALDSMDELVVSFDNAGSINAEGGFVMRLSAASRKYVRAVDSMVWEYVTDATGQTYAKYLGTSRNYLADWEALSFKSDLGQSVPCILGEKLTVDVVYRGDGYTVYTAPVLVNGQETNLRFSRNAATGEYTILGTWAGIDELDAYANALDVLEDGDVVTLRNRIWREGMAEMDSNLEDGFTFTYESGSTKIVDTSLQADAYKFVFGVTDIQGDIYYSSAATFTKSNNGTYVAGI